MVSSARRFGQYPHMQDVLVLGPQFRAPNLRDALGRACLGGPVAVVTAGWQEREGELDALRAAPRRDRARPAALRADRGRLRPGRPSCTRPIARARTSCAGCRTSTACASTTPRRPRASCCRRRTAAPLATSAPGARRSRRCAGSTPSHLRDLRAIHARFERRLVARATPACSPGSATELEQIDRGRRRRRASPAATSPCCSTGCGCSGSARALRGTAGRRVVGRRDGRCRARRAVPRLTRRRAQATPRCSRRASGSCRGVVFLPHAATRLRARRSAARRAARAALRARDAACTLDDGDQLLWRRGRLARRRRVARGSPRTAPSSRPAGAP